MSANLYLTAAIAVAAAFITSPSQAEEDKRIGEEVDRICFGRSINGWKTVDKEDDVILLEKGVNNWFYVELLGACDYRVLRSALHIGIDSRPAGGCITRGDIIIVEDSPGFDRRCSIRRMYRWDPDAPAPGEEESEEEQEEEQEETEDAY